MTTITDFSELVRLDPRIVVQRDPDFIGAPTRAQLVLWSDGE
jgi:hypothetical protein